MAATLALAACGGGSGGGGGSASGGDPKAGAKVFAKAGCGDCHALAKARTVGMTGPSLDDRQPDFDKVVRQVSNGGAGMPSFELRLSEREIRDVAAFVEEATGGPGGGKSVAGTFKPNKRKLESCNGDFACMEQAYGNIAYYQGPKAALRRFEREIAQPGPVESNCHRISHAIGAASLAHHKNKIGQAFADGSAACWSGYYHGVLERAFVDVDEDEVGPESRKMCADKDLRSGPSFILYQCVHGLGHGLMIYTGYDLPLSLRICDQQKGSWDQTSCTGGVFMENLSSSYGVKSRWLKDNDLIYPCNTVAKRHKIYCYLMVTSRILPVVNYDFGKAAKLCRKSERGWVDICFESLGRDASGNTRQNPRGINEHCALAGDMQDSCLYGAARDMTSNYAGGREASVMCNLAPTKHRAYCFEGIGTIIGSLNPGSAERRSACKAVAGRYSARCIKGSGA